MANTMKRGNSYLIRVSAGYDHTGKQIVKSMTWKIPEGMTEKRIEKELQKVAHEFEQKVLTGMIADEKSVKFAEFAERWFRDYAETQLRPRTIDGYRRLMDRILPALGHLYIDKIKPTHLTAFYSDLSRTTKTMTYHSIVDLKEVIKSKKYTMSAFSEKSGVPLTSLKSAENGRNISEENATKIAKTLRKKLSDLFEPSNEDATLSTTTIGKYHRVLSSMFETAVKWGLIVANPCERVDPPKNKKQSRNKKPQFLTVEESRRMLDLLEDEPIQYRNAITVLLFTGMRRGELLGLEWGDLDESKGTLRICKSIQYLPDRGIFEDDTKNESSNRVIRLSGTVLSVLRSQRKWQIEQRLKLGECWEASDRIFTNPEGKLIHPDTISGWFREFVRRNDLPEIHLHSLRHTNATIQIANGSSVTTVAGFLGHTNANTTTKIYAHAIQEAQAVASDMLDEVLNPRNKKRAKQA